jgi:hypothetical protein
LVEKGAAFAGEIQLEHTIDAHTTRLDSVRSEVEMQHLKIFWPIAGPTKP